MGRVTVEIELRNRGDSILVERGLLSPDKVRIARIPGVVDTGATQLVVPAQVAEALGLKKVGEAFVPFADNRRESRGIVEDAEVLMLDRRATFQAVVEPNREDALIGAVVLETLDFIVDCKLPKLVPRDPHRILAEIE